MKTYRSGEKIAFKRTKDGLRVKLLDKSKHVDLSDLMEDLFWDDMYLIDTGDGWCNIGHENSDSVYHVNDYAYNMLEDLNDTGKALFPLSSMKYSEYELID